MSGNNNSTSTLPIGNIVNPNTPPPTAMLSIDGDPVSLYYQQFGGGGGGTPLFPFAWPLVIFSALNAVVPVVGVVLNFLLLFVTVRSKSLHGTCNVLLAAGACCDLVYLGQFFIPLALTLTAVNFILLSVCFWFQVVPVFGLFSSVWVVLFVGLDRLLSVCFPLWHRNVQRWMYFGVIALISGGYSLYVLVLAFFTVRAHPNWPVMCQLNDLFSLDGLGTVVLYRGLAINSVTLVVYIIVGLVIRQFQRKRSEQKSNHTASSEANKNKIFKSLLTIVLLVVGAYWAVCAFGLATASVQNPFFVMYAGSVIRNAMTTSASTCNAPILLAFSDEYRRTFHTALGPVPVLRWALKFVPKPGHGGLSTAPNAWGTTGVNIANANSNICNAIGTSKIVPATKKVVVVKTVCSAVSGFKSHSSGNESNSNITHGTINNGSHQSVYCKEGEGCYLVPKPNKTNAMSSSDALPNRTMRRRSSADEILPQSTSKIAENQTAVRDSAQQRMSATVPRTAMRQSSSSPFRNMADTLRLNPEHHS